MAKAEKQNEGGEVAEKESVQSILGKIKSIVSGKEKVTLDEPKAEAPAEEEELLELVEMVEMVDDEAAPEAASEQGSEIEQQLAQVADDQTAQAEVAAEQPAEEPKPESDEFVDILKEIDQALEKQYVQPEAEKPAEAVAPAPVVEEVVAPEPEPVAVVEEVVVVASQQVEVKNEEIVQPEPIKPFDESVSKNIMADGNGAGSNQTKGSMTEEKKIISQEIAARSSKAIQDMLTQIPGPQIDSPAFRNATTLEDITSEMLRPMLSHWLDKNLEVIVRDIVEREIKKIIPRD